jgi:Putative ammonia monooxygenase.
VTAVLYVVISALIIAYILHKRYHWKTSLSWMSAAPGRTSDLLAISQDIEDLNGRDRLALACVHTMRQVYFTLLISVIVTFV